MTKVTLLGDSIRAIGYGARVAEMLKDRFEFFQPNDNCRFAKYTLRGLFDWEKDMRNSRIVHWNNGLWDVCNLFGDGLFTSETEYLNNMTRIADILISRYEKVIFATTTPVNPQNPYNTNEDIERYNRLIIPVLRGKGIIINDLYTLVASDIDRYIRKDDNIHLTEDGIRVCSIQVAKILTEVSKTLPLEQAPAPAAQEYISGAPV